MAITAAQVKELRDKTGAGMLDCKNALAASDGDIEKAINKADIGINPQNDGKVIRLNFPPLTEERRKEIAKDIHKKCEEAKVNVRGVRREAMDFFKKAQCCPSSSSSDAAHAQFSADP